LLVPGGLDAQQRAQRGVRLARHRGGLGTTAAQLHRVVDRQPGGVKRGRALGIHRHDPHREAGLEGIVGMQRDDGIHR